MRRLPIPSQPQPRPPPRPSSLPQQGAQQGGDNQLLIDLGEGGGAGGSGYGHGSSGGGGSGAGGGAPLQQRAAPHHSPAGGGAGSSAPLAFRTRGQVSMSPLYLPYISRISPYISPISPYISPISLGQISATGGGAPGGQGGQGAGGGPGGGGGARRVVVAGGGMGTAGGSLDGRARVRRPERRAALGALGVRASGLFGGLARLAGRAELNAEKKRHLKALEIGEM